MCRTKLYNTESLQQYTQHVGLKFSVRDWYTAICQEEIKVKGAIREAIFKNIFCFVWKHARCIIG